MHHGSWTSEVIDELAPTPDDYLIPKHRWSSFHQTHLQLSLRTRGIDTIVLFGGAIHIGVASTAYSARDLDFNIVVVSDACSGPDENLKLFMERIFPIFARVRTADEVVEMFRPRRCGLTSSPPRPPSDIDERARERGHQRDHCHDGPRVPA